jgi:CBS domain-containing protein
MATLVRDMMTRNLITVEADDSVAKVRQLMMNSSIHSVLIPPPRGGRAWRIITETDLLIALNSGSSPEDVPVAAFASPVSFTARPEWTYERALQEMINRGVKHLPVMDGSGNIVGIISSTDILRNY